MDTDSNSFSPGRRRSNEGKWRDSNPALLVLWFLNSAEILTLTSFAQDDTGGTMMDRHDTSSFSHWGSRSIPSGKKVRMKGNIPLGTEDPLTSGPLPRGKRKCESVGRVSKRGNEKLWVKHPLSPSWYVA